MKKIGLFAKVCRVALDGLILILLVLTGVSAQQSIPPEPNIEAVRREEIQKTRAVEAGINRAVRAAVDARDSASKAQRRGRDLLASVADPGREGQVAEALAILAGAVDRLERSATQAEEAAKEAKDALGKLGAATTEEALKEEGRRAEGALYRAEKAAAKAAEAEALALKAQAEIATRAAGASSATYPDPGWRRITPFGSMVGSILAPACHRLPIQSIPAMAETQKRRALSQR